MKVQFEERPEGAATMTPEIQDAMNYYRWIIRRFSDYIGTNILDIGGGYGAHLEFVVENCEQLLSIDLSQDSVALMNERFAEYDHFEANYMDFGSEGDAHAGLVARGFDTITCLNVLEHIEDDAHALKDMHAILAPKGGNLCLQIPAHQWLYGAMDTYAGHYRRYSMSYLREILEAAGFEVVELYAFNVFGVLPYFINNRLFPPKSIDAGEIGLQIKIFNKIVVPIMQQVEKVITPPVGQSILAVAAAR